MDHGAHKTLLDLADRHLDSDLPKAFYMYWNIVQSAKKPQDDFNHCALVAAACAEERDPLALTFHPVLNTMVNYWRCLVDLYLEGVDRSSLNDLKFAIGGVRRQATEMLAATYVTEDIVADWEGELFDRENALPDYDDDNGRCVGEGQHEHCLQEAMELYAWGEMKVCNDCLIRGRSGQDI